MADRHAQRGALDAHGYIYRYMATIDYTERMLNPSGISILLELLEVALA